MVEENIIPSSEEGASSSLACGNDVKIGNQDLDGHDIKDEDEQDVWTVATGIATPMVVAKSPVSLTVVADDLRQIPFPYPEDTPEPQSKLPFCDANTKDFELHNIYLIDIGEDASENSILDYFEESARKEHDPLEIMEEATVGTEDSRPPSEIASPIGYKVQLQDKWFQKLPKWLRVTIFVYACVLVVGTAFATTVVVLSYSDPVTNEDSTASTSHPPEDTVIPGPVMVPFTSKPGPTKNTPAPAIYFQTAVPATHDIPVATTGTVSASAVPAICEDSSHVLFAVTDEPDSQMVSCQWLLTQVADRLMMCKPGFDAYELCRATCGRCPN